MGLRLKYDIRYGKDFHPAGTRLSPLIVYPTIFLQTCLFGAFCFGFAYAGKWPNMGGLVIIGGFGIMFFALFYGAVFGLAEMGWMFVNGAIGVLGILSQINVVLSWFGKSADDFGFDAHLFPVIYWIMASFVLWQLVLDLTGSREDAARRWWANLAFSLGSLTLYATLWLTDQ